MRLVGKQGRKAAVRESREIAGFAVKRGRKSAGEEAIKRGIRKADNLAALTNLTAAGVLGISLFLANAPDATGAVDLCDEMNGGN